jgi:hypothetical protein
MRSLYCALLFALLLPAMGAASAQQTQQRSHKSFTGGFSSQKARPASAKPGAGFGSLGDTRGARGAAQPRSESALSQRLAKSTAQANAVRTLDARRAEPSLPAPPRQYDAAERPAYTPAPVIVQQRSSGIGDVLTGYLLGRASGSQGQRHDYPATRAGDAAPAPANTPSLGGAIMRTFAWLLALAVLAWGAYFIWNWLTRGKARSQANYSFER